MGWYLKTLLADRRFKIAAGVGLGSIGAIVLFMLIGTTWGFYAAAFGFFPLLMLSILAVFVVFGIIVRTDYLDRKGR